MMSAVHLEGVTKTFGKVKAVDDLNLQVPEGAIYGFIGPNGSGKTTTIRIILRILYPDRGRVSVMGNDHGKAADDCVGYLPEERGLYRKMYVRESLLFHAALKGFRKARPEADRWLERLDLADWANKKVEALSKGMAQKLQFLVAVIARPKLLILDEPFAGLDPVNMEVLKDAVLSLREQGTTVVLSTHDMDVAEKMCDTIFMIFKGKKVLDGTLQSIQAQYGQDTIRIRAELQGQSLQDLAGVERINDFGRYQELRMAPEADTQAILQQLVQRCKLEHFEIAHPSLRDIFVRIAGPEAREPVEEHHV
jgi:ABC-2 type transport system ATP-binding protein